jgi:carboxypeptidase D
MRCAALMLSVGCILYFRIFASASSEYERATAVLAQRGEVYLALYPRAAADLKPYTGVISIDRIEDGYKVLAYAGKRGFEKIAAAGVPYKALTPPCLAAKAAMSDYRGFLNASGPGASETGVHSGWFAYPTYGAYVQIMEKFQDDYPQRARLIDLGPTVQGRRLYLLKVSANVSANAGRPRFLHVALVHGDELLNYMNALHMIDTLLSGYETVPRFRALLDNIEIWFVPLCNPDGCYHGGDSTVQSARRFNADTVDINRNFPCPCGRTEFNHAITGEYTAREPETAALLNLWNRYVFHLSTDAHSGTETMLWPYGSMERRPCDEEWYTWVCRRFVDQVHGIDSAYFTQCGGDGMGNLYSELYECHGTLVDYSVFSRRGRMIVMETALEKMMTEADLKKYWEYNREALLRFYEILFTGIQGTVRNAANGEPIIAAKVQENDHDFDSAWTYTDSAGFYVRFIQTGSWNLTFSKPGFASKTVPVSVTDYEQKYPLNVELEPVLPVAPASVPPERRFMARPSASGIMFVNNDPVRTVTVAVYTMNGSRVADVSLAAGTTAEWPEGNGAAMSAGKGCYIARVTGESGEFTARFMLNR